MGVLTWPAQGMCCRLTRGSLGACLSSCVETRLVLMVLWVLSQMVRTGAGVNVTFGDTSNRIWPCPSRCSCSPDGRVDCRGLNLSSVPLSLPTSTSSLRMSHNKMRKLTNISLSEIQAVKRLYLDHNHLTAVSHGAFRGAGATLEVLHLNDNILTTLHPSTFSGLYHLRHLFLQHNALSTLDPETFADLRHLHVLDLRFNALSVLVPATLRPLGSLTRLGLGDNPLGPGLHHAVFGGLERLRELSMSNMKLRTLASSLLSPLPSLHKLDLSANSLTTLKVGVIKALHNLQYFNLSGNPFKCDCKLRPLYEWMTNQPRLEWAGDSAPRCRTPTALRGQLVYVLTLGNLTCPRRPPPRRTTYITRYRTPDVVNSEPLPYDRMMGWYTAATLSTMLVLFLIGVALDKAKRRFYRWRRAKRDEKERLREQERKALQLKNRRPRLAHTRSTNSSRDHPFNSRDLRDSRVFNSRGEFTPLPPGSLNLLSPQSSFDGPGSRHSGSDILKRNDLLGGRSPLPKVEIHLAPNLHDLANFRDPAEYLRSQDILIDMSDTNIEKADAKFLLWPASAKLNKLQRQVETSL